MDGNKKTLIEFFGLIMFLWLIWFYGGGPARIDRADKPFLKPPSPLNTDEVFGDLPAVPSLPDISVDKRLRIGESKDYSDARLSFSGNGSGGEYLEVYVLPTSKNAINLTGWMIKGVIDAEARTVGNGVYSFSQGKVNKEENIWIYPGEKAFIIPGESPVGVSFKLNKCIGYLEQFQVFIPHLPQSCPQFGIDGQIPLGTDTECGLFIRSIPRCNAYIKSFPSSVLQTCSQLITKRLNYNSCVSEHVRDADFRKGEWRVYLGGSDTFGSKNGDLINIFDADNRQIDSIFYSK